MICSDCGEEISVGYMCDEDEDAGTYCRECFEKKDCLDQHGEGCCTQVFEGGDEPVPA